MKKYRIVESRPGVFEIEQRVLWFFWVLVSPNHPLDTRPPMTSVQQARERIQKWRESDAFIKNYHDAN